MNMTKKVKVKICGIKTFEAAQTAFDEGADFLGFNFVPNSKRFIKPELAKEMIKRLSNSTIIVGVFMNEDSYKVNRLIDYLGLDFVQLHGNESPKYIESIKNAGIIKTFPLPAQFNIEKTIKNFKKYKVDYFLLDREKQGKGELLDPDKVHQLTAIFPIILAGGLTIENVADVVHSARPQVVDVAGGVESNGKKDRLKIKKFINEIHLHGSIDESKALYVE